MSRHVIITWILTSVLYIGVFPKMANANALLRTTESNTIDIQSGFPEELHVSLYADDSPVHLRLKRGNAVDSNVPLYVICNGSIFEKNVTGDMSVGYYQDIDTGASVEVSCENATEECVPSLSGSFYRNRLLYELGSLAENDTLTIPFRRRRSTDTHKITQRTDQDGNEIDPISSPASILIREVPVRNRKKRAGYKITRCVEMVAVISYDVFERWFQRSPRYEKWAKEEDALFKIRRYFAMVIQGVDLRYSSIMAVDFSLCVRLSAYVIATTRGDSPWTEQKVFADAVDGADVLPFFRSWSIHNGGKIGRYDHIQLFTGYDVTTGVDASAVGLSYIASICLQSWAVSIVEDNQDIMNTVTAATHELGHSLGAYHDGNQNVCPSSSKYIMAPKIGRPLHSDKLNPWKFSPCTISYFASTIRLLKKYSMDCMLDKPRLLDDGLWEHYTKQLPGQIYSPDQQCRLMHGETSFMSRKLLQEREVSNLCTGMWCHSGGSKFTFHIPARGTSCGSKKWCVDGICVTNSTAPELSETCPYGDYQTEIFIGWDCQKLVKHWDYLCTWDYQGMKTKCCSACAPVLKTRGKRSLPFIAPPSDEEIKRELNRRLIMDKYKDNIVEPSLELNNLKSLLGSRHRQYTSKVDTYAALKTGFTRYFSSRTATVRNGQIVIGDMPMSA